MSEAYTDDQGFKWAAYPLFTSANLFLYANEDDREYCEISEELKAMVDARKMAMETLPANEVYVKYSETTDPQRMLVMPVDTWSEEEKVKFNDFKQFCNERDGIPANIQDCFRYLQAKLWDNQKAYDMLKARSEMLTANFPLTVNEKMTKMIHEGLFYVAGWDKHNRPILVLQPKVMFNAGATRDECLATITKTILFASEHLFVDGKCENIIMIINMLGVGVFSIGYKLIAQLVPTLPYLFRGRVRRSFIVNAPTTFAAIWKVTKPFLDESMLAKITITRQAGCDELHEMVESDQLEESMGGSMTNK
jgi:hypothetical protein